MAIMITTVVKRARLAGALAVTAVLLAACGEDVTGPGWHHVEGTSTMHYICQDGAAFFYTKNGDDGEGAWFGFQVGFGKCAGQAPPAPATPTPPASVAPSK